MDDESLSPAIGTLSALENACTKLLLRLSVLLPNASIMSDWKLKALEPLREFDHRMEQSMLVDHSIITVTGVIRRQLERKDILIYSLWAKLRESFSSYPMHKNLHTLALKIASF